MKADQGFQFRSGKNYVHSVGLSVAFRQWRAESHCRFLHGYSLQVQFTFSAPALDHRNWVVDFGSLKSVKGWLESLLDHKTLVAEDDPNLNVFKSLHEQRLIDLQIVPHCGMEALSYFIYQYAEQWLRDAGYGHVSLEEVIVKEHEANWASYGRQS